MNASGFIITKTAPNKANAIRLGEWLVSPEAQRLYASQNFEYPVRTDVPLDPLVASWGELKKDSLPMSEIARHKKEASELVDEVQFNDGPGS